MNILIAGWFGSDNLGDELLLDTTINLFRAVDPALVVRVICADPSRVTALHNVEALNFPTVRPMAKTLKRHHRVLRALRKSDVLILGPGTVFQERSHVLRPPGTIPMLARLVLLGRLMRCDVFLFGAGVREGSSAIGRLAMRMTGWLCKGMWLRDVGSARVFGPKARAIGDVAIAGAFEGERRGEISETGKLGPLALVSMRPMDPIIQARLAESFRVVLGELALDGYRARFVAMALGNGAKAENDVSVYEESFADQADLVNIINEAECDFAELNRRLSASFSVADIVIATRLHAAVVAAVLGRPVVAIAYERKVRVTMDQLGLGQWVVDPEVTPAGLSRIVRDRIAAGPYDLDLQRLGAPIRSAVLEMLGVR